MLDMFHATGRTGRRKPIPEVKKKRGFSPMRHRRRKRAPSRSARHRRSAIGCRCRVSDRSITRRATASKAAAQSVIASRGLHVEGGGGNRDGSDGRRHRQTAAPWAHSRTSSESRLRRADRLQQLSRRWWPGGGAAGGGGFQRTSFGGGGGWGGYVASIELQVMKTFNETNSSNHNRDAERGEHGDGAGRGSVTQPFRLARTGSPGTATAESVVVTSQELDISREQIVPSLGATRYTVGRIVSIRRRRAKTLRSIKPSCVSPAWPRIRSASFTSAANTPTCSIASTMCSCRKAFPGSDRNCRPDLPIISRSSPARCPRNSASARPV